MAEGYCTLEDLRRALREKDLPGDLSQDNQIAVDAITAQTEWLEKTLSRHWYEPSGISEATEVTIPTSARTRDDEHDIPSHGGFVEGASERERYRYRANSDALLEAGPRHERRRRRDLRRVEKREIRLAFGDLYDDTRPAYTRIRFDRRDVEAVNELHVVNEDGAYDDWVAESDYDGGVGNQHRGEDYWVRVNNGGWSELYLDVHALDDDIPGLSNAVYVDFDYGHDGIPQTVRRAVALRAGAYFTEKAAVQIPENARLYNVESRAEEMREEATELLDVYRGDQ